MVSILFIILLSYIFFVLVSVYDSYCVVVSLQVLETSLYMGGAAEFLLAVLFYFVHRYPFDSTFTTVSLTRSRSQVYIIYVHYSYIMYLCLL